MNNSHSPSPFPPRVRRLLGNFFLGLTSSREEEELLAALSHIPAEDIPSDLRDDVAVFLALASAPASLPAAPEGFAESLADRIDLLAAEENARTLRASRFRRRYAWWSAGVAAAVAGILFFAPYFSSTTQSDSPLMADDFSESPATDMVEITDPVKAQKIVGRSLALLSNLTRASVRQTESSLSEFEL